MSINLTLRVAKSRGGSHYFPIPENISQQILEDLGKRIVCSSKGRNSLHCALLRSDDSGYYTRVNRALKLIERIKLGLTNQKELFR
jgi:hypothetical protein